MGMRSVGVIGLGEIGSGVAKGVAAAGLPLAVCDVDPAATELFAASAEVAPSPRELASRSDVVVVAVVTDGQVLSVLDPDMGALAARIKKRGVRPGIWRRGQPIVEVGEQCHTRFCLGVQPAFGLHRQHVWKRRQRCTEGQIHSKSIRVRCRGPDY